MIERPVLGGFRTMPEAWRYVLPCGHHSRRSFESNPPERRYRCQTCGEYYHEGDLVDKLDGAIAQ